jgi:hypothetical protein
MSDDLDFDQLGDVGDPFADEVAAPARPMDSTALPAAVRNSPTRGRVHALRWAALIVAVSFDAGWVAIHQNRPELGSSPASEIVLGLAIPLVAAALALAAAVRTGPLGLGLSARTAAILVASAPTVFAAATLVAAPPASDPLFWEHAATCMKATLGFTLVPLALGLWAFRRAFAATATWRTAAIGLASGALAASAMSLACPLTYASHVLLGHGLVMLVAALAGAVIAPAVARS